jgi:hypothetical protein
MPMIVVSQVSEVKSASANHSSSKSESSNSNGAAVDILFNILFSGVVNAQQNKLQQKDEIPGLVSLEMFLQGAAQPGSYYILTPRLRANWGIFSSDFRFNYLIEESIDEIELLRTNDWQILQLNVVTTRDVTMRIGGGLISEQWAGGNTYGEWTGAIDIHPVEKRFGGVGEYRGAESRREISGFLKYRLFDRGVLHGFTTAGIIYQRYYSTVTVWGMQAGMIFNLY